MDSVSRRLAGATISLRALDVDDEAEPLQAPINASVKSSSTSQTSDQPAKKSAQSLCMSHPPNRFHLLFILFFFEFPDAEGGAEESRALHAPQPAASSTDNQFDHGTGSFLERLGASMEKALENFFTKWGTCKLTATGKENIFINFYCLY